MNDNYLLLIVLISVVLYYMHQRSNVDITQQNKDKKQVKPVKSSFEDTNKMHIGKYIDATIDNLIEEKQQLDIKNMSSEFQGLKKHRNEEEIKNMLDNISDFTDKFDRYSRITNDENINLSSKIKDNLAEISKNDNQIYDTFVQDFYDKYKKKLISEENVLNNIGLHGVNDNNSQESFADTQITGDNKIVSFLGRYTVIPYQYTGFNNVYMSLTKYGIEDNNNLVNSPIKTELKEKYVLGFYLLDALVVEYEVDIYIKDKTLLELMPSENQSYVNEANNTDVNIDIMNNLTGIIVDIKNEIPVYNPNYNIVRKVEAENIKNILGNIGIMSNTKLYLFLAEAQFEKRYFNLDGGLNGISKGAYYQETDDDLFRCYSSNSNTLLHLKKTNTINKPFQSLTGAGLIKKLDIFG